MRHSKIISIICLAMLLMSTSIVAIAEETPDNNKVIEWGYSSENPSGNIGTVTYENEDGQVGIQVNTDLIKEYIDAGDSSINLSVQKLFLSVSNAKNKMSTLLTNKGVTSLKQNPKTKNINDYNIADADKYNTYQEFANAISSITPTYELQLEDPNAIVTINAHFCSNQDGVETTISFTDNENKTAQQQYIDYCNSHLLPSAIKGGCFDNYTYYVTVSDGYYDNIYHPADGNCPNGGRLPNGEPCHCGHCVGWSEAKWVTTGSHQESRVGIGATCGYTNGQIISVEYDYLSKQRW